MLEFVFNMPTKIFFGPGKIEVLGAQVKKYSDRILLLYGKNSIKKNGIYDATVAQLKAHGIHYVELSGVDPNPRISTVREGARLCREHNLGFVLAVGGGSVIDCAKGIAAAALYDGDPWDFWMWKVRVTQALPLASILTLSATGSEMNESTVVTNEETRQKHGMGAMAVVPQFSILDPIYTYSVPKSQTAAGTADIMTHIFEFYFSPSDQAYLQDAFSEAVLKTCIHFGPIACEEPENYEARANLMWASSMALNGVAIAGKAFDGFNHLAEHGVSAVYDVTHGAGLAILTPYWMEYILDDSTAGKLATFARNVWGITDADDMAAARKGIKALRDFYNGMGLPARLSEVGVSADSFDHIVEETVDSNGMVGVFKQLNRADVKKILEMAL